MKSNNEIRWGIIGCGDVCEVKSGPAFNKVSHSSLIAVMRRDREKAADFARRHNVPRYYSSASDLINDPDINAVYIATPPAQHETIAIQCMAAGKPVYIEKPIALSAESCERILDASRSLGVKASVAHYRRGLPLFRKIRSMLQAGVIGKPGLIIARTLQAPSEKMNTPGYWRTSPDVSGGGLFFDLAPHQLDIFYWIFGNPKTVRGFSMNQRHHYEAPDVTTAEVIFGEDVLLQGLWAFNVAKSDESETCEIFGDQGKLKFSFFRTSTIDVSTAKGDEKIAADYPVNIQQPMIDDVVKYFRGEGPNPCSVEEALVTMRIIDSTK